MSNTVSTITIIATVAALLFAVVGVQTLWITRSLDRIQTQLDWLSQTIVREHGERIARLEEKVTP